MQPKTFFIFTGCLFAAVILGKALQPNSKQADVAASGALSQSEALTICQYAIKNSMIDYENTDVPYVDNNGSEDEFYFAWGTATKSIRTRNRLGLEVPASASCIVNKTSRAISQLTINGESIR